MPTCREMCPIARQQSERIEEKGKYPRSGKQFVAITIVAYGVSVSALETNEYPGVTSTLVSQNATPSCNLAERITRYMHRIGTSGATEDCVYVPGKKVWVTVSNTPSKK